jgi:hypothetical protein
LLKGAVGTLRLLRQTGADIEKLVGAEVRLAFRAPDGDQVYSARGAEGDRWRKDDAEFVGRCIVVGTDRTGGMADAVVSIDAFKKTVRFNTGKPDRWTRYREEASGASHAGSSEAD